jgi:hypothetical protein
MKTIIKNDICSYTCIENALKAGNNFLYLKKNNLLFEVFPFTNLFTAICDIGDTSLIDNGLPAEFVKFVDMNAEVPNVKFVSDNSIAYYSPLEGDTKEQAMSIIKLFNQLPLINITIYLSNEIHRYVVSFANQNITFYCYTNPTDLFIESNKIITFGFSARYFIQQKIPTIIIGPYGFGGWVTPDNINYLLKENFRGRPSGRYNETLHHEILEDEILEIKECANLEHILDENVLIVDNYLNSFIIKNINTIITDTDKLYKKWTNSSKKWFLKPKLVSNVQIRRNSDTICVQRRVINDVLFSLPESDFDFLDDLKNDLTCKDLQVKHKLTEEDFWEIITPLWELKAIYFSL